MRAGRENGKFGPAAEVDWSSERGFARGHLHESVDEVVDIAEGTGLGAVAKTVIASPRSAWTMTRR